jgi:hypothetical protein
MKYYIKSLVKKRKSIYIHTKGPNDMFVAHLGTWRGGGGQKRHPTALQEVVALVRNTKEVKFLFWEKKRLEPLRAALKLLGSGSTRDRLGSSAHRLRAEPVATLPRI